MKKLYTLVAAVLLTTISFAQAPEKMSYQAVIRDSGDALITNQGVGMQISILQGNASGTAVYTETQTPTTNVNGLATLQIGAGTTSDVFSVIDWANGPYFIKTETDPAGGSSYSITGTSQLLSVPYALYAKTSGSSNYAGKSTSSINLGSFGGCMTYPSYGCASGTATITTTTTLSYTAGMRVRISETANPTLEFIEGVIQSYNGTTMVITVDTLITSASGTFTSWDINLGSGLPGVPGAMGTSDGKNILGSSGATNPNGATNPSDYASPIDGDQYTNRDTGESFIYNGTIWDLLPLPASNLYIGPWNAQTNTPTLSSGIGTKGNYYVVSTAGFTNINGINYWEPGHWIMFNGTVWEKVDYTDPVATGNTYAYSVVSDFIGSINQNKLYDEIVDEAGITSNLLDVDRIDDTIYIVFNSVLSAFEKTQLDNIIATHIGTDDPDISLNTIGAYNTTTVIQSAQTANRTITLPDATTILVGRNTSDILTNKTIDTANNTLILDAGDVTTGLFSDARIAESNVTQHVGSLVHQSLSGAGTNTHAQIDTHIADSGNPHSVTKNQIGLSNVENIKMNLNATTSPSSNDDNTSGYSVGSRWLDVISSKEYVCVDGSISTAVWIETTSVEQVSAGTGLTKTGNTIDANGSITIIANANSLEVNSSNTANQVLLSSGSVGTAGTFGALPIGNSNSVSGILNISNGGTNSSSFTAGNRIIATNSGNTALEATSINPSSLLTTTGVQTLTNKTLDATTYFADTSDSTKKVQLDLSSITTGTNRILTMPDANITIVGTSTVQTLNNKTLTSTTNNITANSLHSTTTTIDVSSSTAPITGQVLTATSGTSATWQTPSPTISNNMVSSTVVFSTIATTYIVLNSMTITPVAGTYMVSFSASGNSSSASADCEYSIHIGGSIVSDSHRKFLTQAGIDLTGADISMHSQSIVTVNGSQTIDVRVKTTSGTFTVNARNMILLKLN